MLSNIRHDAGIQAAPRPGLFEWLNNTCGQQDEERVE